MGIVFTGPLKNTRQERLVVRTLADTLEGSLQRVLREDLGGTYGVSVEPDYTKRPDEEYRLTISFACDPARTNDLVKALFTVIDEFKENGPSSGQLADVRAARCATSKRTVSRTASCCGRSPTPTSTAKTFRISRRFARHTIS